MAAADQVLSIDGLVDPVEVGRGGFAVVYRAHQPAFDRTVAVKILNAAPDQTSLERFQREVRAMGKLSEHPSIATVLDAGLTESGQPFLLMPFFSGGSLQSKLLDGGTFTPEDTVRIGVRLASALAAAHAEGILHRDVKPANVMLGRYGDPLLVDFGIARIAGGHETTTGVVTATLSHAAPELLDGKPPSVASDVYALGSTLYTLLTGRPPFSSTTDQSVVPLIRRIMTDPLPPMPSGVPTALAAVLARATAKEAEDRFPDAAAMGRALEVALTGATGPLTSTAADLGEVAETRDSPTEPASAAADPTPDEVSGPTRTLSPPSNLTVNAPAPPNVPPPIEPSSAGPAPSGSGTGNRGLVIGGVLAALVLVIGGIVVLSGGGDEPEDPGPSEVVNDGVVPVVTPGGLPLGNVDGDELALLSADPSDTAEIEPNTVLEIGLEAGRTSALTFPVREAGVALRISTAQNDQVDPVGALFRDGELVAADDDNGGDGNVLLDVPDLASGDYEVRFAGLNEISGSLLVSLQLEPARPLVPGATGELAELHEVDVFRVDVRPGQSRGLVITSAETVELRAVDSVGAPVDATSGDGRIEMDLSVQQPGTYYVYVAPGDGTASYTADPLAFVRAAPQAPVAPNLQGQELPSPGTAAREVDPFEVSRVDLVEGESVALPFSTSDEGTVMRALVRSPDGAVDPIVMLYGGDGALLAASDDEGFGDNGQDALIDYPVPAGDYVVVLADLAGDTGGAVDVTFALTPAVGLAPGPGELRGADVPDVYSLVVEPGSPPPATVRLMAEFDGLLRLIAEDGAIMSVTGGGGNPPIPLNGLGQGTFYVVASSREPGPYLLTVGG